MTTNKTIEKIQFLQFPFVKVKCTYTDQHSLLIDYSPTNIIHKLSLLCGKPCTYEDVLSVLFGTTWKEKVQKYCGKRLGIEISTQEILLSSCFFSEIIEFSALGPVYRLLEIRLTDFLIPLEFEVYIKNRTNNLELKLDFLDENGLRKEIFYYIGDKDMLE